MLSFFPRGVLDEILNLIESVSEDFPSYFYLVHSKINRYNQPYQIISRIVKYQSFCYKYNKSRKENPQKLTQLSSRSHPRHLVGKRTAPRDTITDITSDNKPIRNAIINFNKFVSDLDIDTCTPDS